jgi:uncharacterized protein (TIGR02001 family)
MSCLPLRATAALLLAACACAARADEAPPPFVYGYVQLMSEYIGRGLSQSVGQVSSQAEVDVNPGAGLYGNLSAVHIGWIDKIYAGASVHVEVDGVLGWREFFAHDGEVKFGLLQLQFPGSYPRGTKRPDTTEGFAYVRWKGVSARLNYDLTDSFGTADSRGAWYLDTNANAPLGDDWTVGAHLGRKQSRGHDPVTGASNADRFSYADYKLSLTRLFPHAYSASLQYSWTTADPNIYTLAGYRVGGNILALVLEKDF